MREAVLGSLGRPWLCGMTAGWVHHDFDVIVFYVLILPYLVARRLRVG